MRGLVACLLILGACTKHKRGQDAPAPATTAAPAASEHPPARCLTLVDCHAQCQRGITRGCTGEAAFLAFGWGVPKDGARSDRLLREACAHYDADGCRMLVELHLGAEPADANLLIARAASLYRVGCDKAQAEACRQLAELSELSAAKVTPSEGSKLMKQACQLGDADACFIAIDAAEGAPPELRERLATLTAAGCQVGDAHACQLSGRPELLARALTLFARECDLGFPPSCYEAGNLAASSPDATLRERATTYRRRACQLGFEPACRP